MTSNKLETEIPEQLIKEVSEELTAGASVEEAVDLTPKPVEEYIDFAYYICHKILRKYKIPIMAWEDCYMEALLGLVTAYNNYDAKNESGAKFTTFASWRVTGQVLDYLKKLNYLSSIDTSNGDTDNGYGKVIKLNSLSFFSEDSGASSDSYATSGISLYNQAADTDSVFDKSIDQVETKLFVNSLIEKTKLSDKERFILNKRYFEEKKLSEIAEELGCTTVNVSIINKKAVTKLSKYFKETYAKN